MVNNSGLSVYVHCAAGVSRAPAVIIMYLCLFKKLKCWQGVEDVFNFVKAFNGNIHPNIKAIQKCLVANTHFQQS